MILNYDWPQEVPALHRLAYIVPGMHCWVGPDRIWATLDRTGSLEVTARTPSVRLPEFWSWPPSLSTPGFPDCACTSPNESARAKNRRDGGGYHSHSASPCEGCAEINIANHYRELWAINGSLTLSLTNPFGTSDEVRISARTAPFLPMENRQKNHQM
jgi:hypothetical protein